MSDQEVTAKKAIHKSKTMWMAALTAAAGAALSSAPEAVPQLAVGPGMIVIGVLQAVLRVYTSQSVR